MQWSSQHATYQAGVRRDLHGSGTMKTTRHHGSWLIYLLCLLCVPLLATEPVAAQSAQGTQGAQSSGNTFNNQQLDQMLAPVALYPDALLSQILMACTYP